MCKPTSALERTKSEFRALEYIQNYANPKF